MRKNRLIQILLAVILCFIVNTANAGDTLKKVLLINSYNTGYIWTDNITKGVLEAFNEYNNVVVFVEYLDSHRFPTRFEKPLFYSYFSQKYHDEDFDLIMTSDNDALDFVILYTDSSLFKNKPHVSSGIGNPEEYLHFDNLYIVHELVLYRQDFEIMMTIFPDMEEMVFIIDNLTTGQIYQDDVREIFSRLYPNIKLTIYNCIDLETLECDMHYFEYPTVIYNAGMSVDCYGVPVNDLVIAEIIQKSTNAPLFSGQYCGLVENYIGGMTTSGVLHGNKATQIALEHLFNPLPTKQKIYLSESLPVFDYQLLKKHKIPFDLIPTNSIIINKPETFLEKNKQILLISSIIILNLVLIIILLYRSLIIQKRLKKELQVAMEKARQSNKVKTVFLENVSHEMRTPLNSIVGFSDVLLETMPESVELNYLKIISENALALNNIISEIFDFSLLKSHRVELNISYFTIKQLLDEIFGLPVIINHIQKKHIQVSRKLDEFDEQMPITGDREKTFHVLKHIIANAFKFTEKGKVLIRCNYTDNVVPDFPDYNVTDAHRKYVVIGVKDTGIGISPDFMEVVFDPFMQANDDITNANRGIGLGLSMSKSIIEILGGEIRIESTPGKGTFVIFTIPVAINK